MMPDNNKRQEEVKIICAWCGKVKQEGSEPISHGICDRCCDRELKKYENRRSKNEAERISRHR
jgi:hypothetical protein